MTYTLNEYDHKILSFSGRLLLGTGLAFSAHIGLTYSIDNKAFNHVTLSSSSSWLQEHVTDISER